MKHIRVKLGDQAFQVRGRHANVYNVELPEWLPHDIMQAMTEKFQFFAYEQLVILNDPPEGAGPGHAQNPSRESNMSIETASSGVSIPAAQRYDSIINTWSLRYASLPSYYDQISTIRHREHLPDN